MASIEEQLRTILARFAAEVVDEVLRDTGERVVTFMNHEPAAPRVRERAAGRTRNRPAAPRSSRRPLPQPGAGRQGVTEAELDAVWVAIGITPDLRAQQLRAKLGMDAGRLAQCLVRLGEQGRVRAQGKAEATTYRVMLATGAAP